MGFAISLLLIAVGAILAFAVDATVSGLELVTVGWILMVVGALGLIASMIFWSSWGGFRGRSTTVIEDDRRRGDVTALVPLPVAGGLEERLGPVAVLGGWAGGHGCPYVGGIDHESRSSAA